MNKVIFLERIQRERDKFELLLNQAGFTRRLTMKGLAGNLSIKDLLADVLGREQFIADRLNEIQHGVEYAPAASHTALENFEKEHGYPDYESRLFEKEGPVLLVMHKYRNIGFEEIVSQELATYSNILSAFEKLTHAQCLDHDLYHRIAEHTYRPYRRASLEIRRWLKSIAPESNS
jgi:hypothetical protein